MVYFLSEGTLGNYTDFLAGSIVVETEYYYKSWFISRVEIVFWTF